MDKRLVKEVIEFLKEHSDLVNDNKFDELYTEALELFDTSSYYNRLDRHYFISTISYILLKSGIDILSHLSAVPEECFYEADYLPEELVLQDNIKAIDPFAFYGADIKTLCIPSSVEYIGSFSFGHSKLRQIIYEGSWEDWEELRKTCSPIPTSSQFVGCPVNNHIVIHTVEDNSYKVL